jgi:hypothetical protein
MPRPPLDGTVLVTGASSGMGVEFARQVAPTARALVLVARRRERLEALRDELVAAHPRLRVEVEARDLTVSAEVDALVDSLDARGLQVDVLINNAGLLDELGLLDGSRWSGVDRMLQLNVVAFTHLVVRLYRPMVERGRGGILTVSSGFGLVALPGFAAYCGTKHYVTAFTEALRAESAGTGVVVTQACPGPVNTEFLDAPANRFGVGVPPWAMISAERCARWALGAFRSGRAMAVPTTWWIWLSIGSGRLSPRWVLRPVFALVARAMRRRAALAGHPR